MICSGCNEHLGRFVDATEFRLGHLGMGESSPELDVDLSGRFRSLEFNGAELVPSTFVMLLYANRARDGIRHLLFNGLLVYWLVRLVEEENYAGVSLIAGVEFPFYVGSIFGARRSAHRYKHARRIDHLDRALRAAGN